MKRLMLVTLLVPLSSLFGLLVAPCTLGPGVAGCLARIAGAWAVSPAADAVFTLGTVTSALLVLRVMSALSPRTGFFAGSLLSAALTTVVYSLSFNISLGYGLLYGVMSALHPMSLASVAIFGLPGVLFMAVAVPLIARVAPLGPRVRSVET